MKKLLTGLSVLTIIALGLTDLSAQQKQQRRSWSQGGGDRDGRLEQAFKKMDANGDGKISKDEFRGPAEAFTKQDANSDGGITLEEMKKSIQQRMRQRQQQGQGGQGQRKFSPLQQVDTNKDGTITKEEWAAAFSKMDKDGDGKVSPKELMGDKQKKPQKDAKNRMNALDTDGDGKISKAEFLDKTVNQMFTRLDKDGDGFVTNDEAEAARPKGQNAKKQQKGTPKPLVERFDTDGDGKLSKEELTANFTKHFDRMDKNADGFIGKDEKPTWSGGARKAGDRKQAGDKQGANAQRFKEMFNRSDKDGDGMLSREEAPKRLAERFTELDGNDDGYLTTEELAAAAGGGRKAQGKKGVPQYLTDNDSDGDGKLSIEEFSGSKTNFDAIDTDGDGFITAKELNKARMRK